MEPTSTQDPTPESPTSNKRIVNAGVAAQQLAKIGSKDEGIVLRLAAMIIYARKGIEHYELQKDIHLNAAAARDEEGQIKTMMLADGKTQVAVMKNDAESQLAMNRLDRAPASVEGTPPRPFTFKDIKKFAWKEGKIDASLLVQLGPFFKLDEPTTSDSNVSS